MPTKDEQKEILKEAIEEWLDKRVNSFGWWSIKTIAAAVFGYLVYFLVTNGFIR